MESASNGKRIRAYRKLKGYTQEGFAKEIGISVSVLGEIERGQRLPSELMLEKMSNVLNISQLELLSK
ncbi:helix-turn-helix domain-containing protein [Halalkalibacter nanhaiisediminis]|uniref:helix-turn-helix domain-containing protein n=1 Tax=Halalkalibacter nanhaiisediminis TaxID=688079 RepID=UPI0011A86FCC|nr:helix-turn-helix transcriptional regulator [Halalkalibacter nanhaiisediminis]